jgi:hypothetical protein
MENPTGESSGEVLRLDCDRRLMLQSTAAAAIAMNVSLISFSFCVCRSILREVGLWCR